MKISYYIVKKKYSLPEKAEIQALIKVMDHFMKTGIVASEKEFGLLIGEKNESGLTDIKAGRKKLSLRAIQHLKNSDRRININAFINPDEPVIIEEEGNEQSESMDVKETFYTELIEKNERYTLMPRAVLTDYKIVPDKILDKLTKSHEGEKEALIAKYNSEIEAIMIKHEKMVDGLKSKSAILESEIKRLESEKMALERQIAAQSK